MLKILALATTLVIAATGVAAAACPASVPGSSQDAIAANQQRVICLQQQIDATSAQRRTDMQINSLQNRFDQLTIQRRFDNLPKAGQL